jgi:TonB family protein
MKHYIFLITFLMTLLNLGGCKSESKKNNLKNLGTCSDGLSNAESDAEKGIYKLFSYGLPHYDDWDFQKFYEEYVENQYGIKIGNAGCIVYDETECYSNRMKELIFKKFGKDILKKAKKQAKVKYKINIQNKIDNNFIFSKVDSMPTFKNGKEKLNSYLTKSIDNPNDLEGRVLVSFVIEKNGEVTNVKIKSSLNKVYEKKISDVFMKMPFWNSGTHFGQKARVRTTIPLVFKNNN